MASPPAFSPPPECAGPDLVIAGAARSATSFLAAQLGAHPRIDPGSVKEPNFFSRHLDRGVEWYDGLFGPRATGVLRMDGSVSYTYPQFPEALGRLAAAAPGALLVYVVRDPLPRAVSHYHLQRHYFQREPAPDFGAALRTNDLYAGASDYQHWLNAIYGVYPAEQVLVVPFDAVARGDAAAQVCAQVALPPPPVREQEAAAMKNNVVAFRHQTLRVASRTLRRSRLYPAVRARLGAQRLRRLNALVTRSTVLPTVAEALATCAPEQLRELRELEERSRAAVRSCLREQDARTGLDWLAYWQPSAADGPGVST
ncbi:hypothetical protein BH20ACT5_BH20ACT5_07840 [soil metagenome]